MQTIDFARQQIGSALDLLNASMQDMTDDAYNWQPPGTCNSIARIHAHALSAVDFFVNMIVGGRPLLWAEVAPAIGYPANALEIWKSDARVSVADVQAYAAKLREAATATLAAQTDADLERTVETNIAGKQTCAWVMQLAATHTAGHSGEISAIKGMQGLKGLPF